jgi:hypothetical protein
VCWRCGEKGNIISYIKNFADKTFPEVLTILKEFQERYVGIEEQKIEIETPIKENLSIPKEFKRLSKDYCPQIVYDFLLNRGFDPINIVMNKELYYPEHLGKYKFRLVVPIVYNKKIVSFVGRDVTNQSINPYLMSGEKDSILSPKHTLYNYDSIAIGGKAILVEGIIDQWKLGGNSIASFGTQVSPQQIAKIKDLKLQKLFILFDNEDSAQESAYKLSKKLWFIDVEIIKLSFHKDPGELSIKEGQKLINEILKHEHRNKQNL